MHPKSVFHQKLQVTQVYISPLPADPPYLGVRFEKQQKQKRRIWAMQQALGLGIQSTICNRLHLRFSTNLRLRKIDGKLAFPNIAHGN